MAVQKSNRQNFDRLFLSNWWSSVARTWGGGWLVTRLHDELVGGGDRLCDDRRSTLAVLEKKEEKKKEKKRTKRRKRRKKKRIGREMREAM